jgi:hypothetical protein
MPTDMLNVGPAVVNGYGNIGQVVTGNELQPTVTPLPKPDALEPTNTTQQVGAVAGSVLGTYGVTKVTSTVLATVTDAVGVGANTVGGTSLKIPGAASMSNLEARQWYLAQETNIPNLIDTTASLEQQAYQAWGLRDDFRTAARNAMSDQGAAAKLNVTNPNLAWEQTVQKYSGQYSGNELWQQIVGASQRSNVQVNQSLGITLPLKKP